VPLPEQYRRQLIETHARAEREARWDPWLELARAVGEISLWTVLGATLIFFAFLTFDVQLGRIYWLAGCLVWIGGVSFAMLSAYRRGVERGDW
jgi:hypothetical protein